MPESCTTTFGPKRRLWQEIYISQLLTQNFASHEMRTTGKSGNFKHFDQKCFHKTPVLAFSFWWRINLKANEKLGRVYRRINTIQWFYVDLSAVEGDMHGDRVVFFEKTKFQIFTVFRIKTNRSCFLPGIPQGSTDGGRFGYRPLQGHQPYRWWDRNPPRIPNPVKYRLPFPPGHQYPQGWARVLSQDPNPVEGRPPFVTQPSFPGG